MADVNARLTPAEEMKFAIASACVVFAVFLLKAIILAVLFNLAMPQLIPGIGKMNIGTSLAVLICTHLLL